MISVIVCSVSPERLARLKENIQRTIGCDYEVVAIDNREAGYSIAKAYNLGASQAVGEYLCFAHEDIAFYTDGWGEIIEAQLSVDGVGYVGFAGSMGKPKELSAWYFSKDYRRINLVEKTSEKSREWRDIPDAENFSQVVTLDGLCLMASRRVWSEVKFDEKTFTGFHFYDLDVTVAATAKGYKNYVCGNIEVEHFSMGSYNRNWYEWAEVFTQKWGEKLPFYTENLSDKKIARNERIALRSMTYLLIRKRILSRGEARSRVRKVLRKSPFAIKSYLLLIIFVKSLHSLKKNI